MATECIDSVARQDIVELQTIIYGPDKNDGLCSRVGTLEDTCAECQRGTNVEVAKTNAKSQFDVAKFTLLGVALMQAAQLIMSLVKK